jgi:hypothetical protein
VWPLRSSRQRSRFSKKLEKIRSWGGWTRTTNFRINSPAVCQLTYTPVGTGRHDEYHEEYHDEGHDIECVVVIVFFSNLLFR